MLDINNKIVTMEGKKIAVLRETMSGRLYVERLPACSLGDHLWLISVLQSWGYDAF